MSESKLLVSDRDIVTPGQVIAEGMEYFPGLGTYRLGDKILANQVGLLHADGKVLKTTPLASPYLPIKDDVIIGKVIDILMSGWRVDIGGGYSAVLPLKDATFDFIRKGDDLTEYFDLGDYVVCKITQVTTQNLIDISMKGPGLRKLRGGQFIRINSAKVPRVIGRKGSMVSMIKQATDCQVSVGQNGIVWISGEPQGEVLAVRCIEMIGNMAHVSGLTEKVKQYLEKATGKKVEPKEDTPEEHQKEEKRPPRQGGFKPRPGGPKGPSKGR